MVLFAACSGEKDRLSIEGSFRGLNQGELYIYGLNGTHSLDTITLHKGTFQYRIPLKDTITFVLVFPNFSELPIFAMPGDEITVEGDATHLKETTIEGSSLNDDMTRIRKAVADLTPKEATRVAAKEITDNPTSPISRYLFDRYFIRTTEPVYATAHELAEHMRLANPDDKLLPQLCRQLDGLRIQQEGLRIPTFSATDINGRRVSSADLNAKANIITLWATWNYESVAIQNLLNRLSSKYGDDLKVLSVCIDADVKECRRIISRDSVRWSTVCDGNMWETPILQKTGLTFLPDNIVIDQKGNIIAHTLNYQKLSDKLKELLE